MKFNLPELGEGVHEGELVKWRVKVGEHVAHDQPLCELMTDKATIEVPSPFEGKITALNAKEGQVVSVGTTIVEYEGKGGAQAAEAPKSEPAPAKKETPAPRKEAPTAAAPIRSAPAPMAASAPVTESSSGDRSLAAPSTRKLAREMGVDLGRVRGSGPEGRIMKTDLSRYLNVGGGKAPMVSRSGNAGSSVGREERVPFKGLRKKIAEKMRLSKDHAAHFTYVEEADATALVRLRNEAKEIGALQGVKVTYLPFVMKAMVAALRQYPILNSSLDEEKGELVYKHYYNIGLSVQTEDGLTAPVIKDVENKTIMELARDIQDVVERARHKKLTLEDFKDGTITLTNAGSIGGLFATPVINVPEVSILGFNKIFRKPVVRTVRGQERVVIRDWTYFSISLDHRVVDGAVGAEFMKLFIRYIENPALLLMENF